MRPSYLFSGIEANLFIFLKKKEAETFNRHAVWLVNLAVSSTCPAPSLPPPPQHSAVFAPSLPPDGHKLFHLGIATVYQLVSEAVTPHTRATGKVNWQQNSGSLGSEPRPENQLC